MIKNYPSFYKKVLQLILISSILKLVFSGLIELGNDEVYYWTYALQTDWNHFDHPPMVGWMIRVTSLNLYWVSEISLRLGSIICSGFATWFIYLTAKFLATDKAGWYAALLYQFAIYTSIIAGLFILPDSPQMAFWTGALYVMSVILFKPGSENKTSLWVLLGAIIGLSILCKVHGLYLWVGFGISILFLRIKWLSNFRIYISFVISLIFMIPIIYWNIQYNFITYRFHAERVTHTNLQWDLLGREILGEFAYQNPIVFLLMLFAVFAAIGRKIFFKRKGTQTWLFAMSIPMIVFFWVIALFNPTLPHWTGPAYIPLFLLSAIYLDQQTKKIMPSILVIAGILIVGLSIAAIGVVRFSSVHFGSHNKENYGEYCPTLDLTGWKNFSTDFNQLVKSDIANAIMKPQPFLLVDKWFPGGHLEFYTARETGLTLIGVGNLTDLHKFAWLNESRKKIQLGDDAYYVVPSNLPSDVADTYSQYFEQIQSPVVINQNRHGGVVRYFNVYRFKNCKKVPRRILP